MKILAALNVKGGVGKTAAAVNLAHAAAAAGRRTLLCDLDPQGAATFYFRVKAKIRGGARALVKAKTDVADLVRESDFPGLDILPADFSLRRLDIELEDAKKPRRRLAKLLDKVRADYDVVILDCPPGLSLSSEAALAAADAIIAPVIPTTLSIRTLEQLETFVSEEGVKVPVWPMLSMMDRRKSLHREIAESLRASRSLMLETGVPSASDVEKMGVRRAPVAAFAPRSTAAKAYALLWLEIEDRLGLL